MTISDLNNRSREIFRHIVDAYVESGEPVGSRTISRRLSTSLSPATIRNVMSDLEEAGLLAAPHTSAGRVPTEAGLRMFVEGLLEVGSLAPDERQSIDVQCAQIGRSMSQMLEEATSMLSGLSRCAGLVFAPKSESRLKHIEFVQLGPGRALVVLISADGLVENRVVELPLGLPSSALVAASNYLAARLVGRTLDEARHAILAELEAERAELDALTARVVAAGLAIWTGRDNRAADGYLVVRGQANLLGELNGAQDLERIRALFQALETKEQMARLLDATNQGQGVQIFIGSESELFGHAGCSAIIAPFKNGEERIVGAIGVIGPTRMNYARIIPMVDYTAKVIGKLLG